MASTDLEYEFNWDGNESQYDAQSLHGHMAYGRGGDLNSVQQPFQLRPGILLYCMVKGVFCCRPLKKYDFVERHYNSMLICQGTL